MAFEQDTCDINESVQTYRAVPRAPLGSGIRFIGVSVAHRIAIRPAAVRADAARRVAVALLAAFCALALSGCGAHGGLKITDVCEGSDGGVSAEAEIRSGDGVEHRTLQMVYGDGRSCTVQALSCEGSTDGSHALTACTTRGEALLAREDADAFAAALRKRDAEAFSALWDKVTEHGWLTYEGGGFASDGSYAVRATIPLGDRQVEALALRICSDDAGGYYVEAFSSVCANDGNDGENSGDANASVGGEDADDAEIDSEHLNALSDGGSSRGSVHVLPGWTYAKQIARMETGAMDYTLLFPLLWEQATGEELR